jgi:hypothetical protein
MQKRNREINIFSLSALDLFCGAMGAFMLLALVALPDYKKSLPLKKEVAILKAQIAEHTKVLSDAQKEIKALEKSLSHTFLVAVIAWETDADIDLHVHTPRGNHYSFSRHNRANASPRVYPNEDAELSMDMLLGGAEVWQMVKADPGQYRINLQNFDNRGSRTPTTVQGLILYRNGSHKFSKSLQTSEEVSVLTVAVDAEGNVDVRNL